MTEPNPYLLDDGPTCISFSGGRTSAYMLHHILDAHDGRLPDDVEVCFANTGKERPETLDFVQECGERWDVGVTWLEYDPDAEHKTKILSHNSAARSGEPFDALIAAKQYLPNPVTRFCTVELKIRRMHFHMYRSCGHEHWASAVGLRADEMHRVSRARARNELGKDRDYVIAPLAEAGATLHDITEFWCEQPFDLRLRPLEGNCDLCFLKRAGKRIEIMRARPDLAAWWIAKETTIQASKPTGARFRHEHTYAELLDFTQRQMNLDFGDDAAVDCFCTD